MTERKWKEMHNEKQVFNISDFSRFSYIRLTIYDNYKTIFILI